MQKEKLVYEKFVRAVDLHAMVSEGDRILVALSGGADSVALLYLFLDLQSRIEFDICAAHLNHGLRGKESRGDERSVKELCQKFSIPCITAREDIQKKAKKNRTSLEVAGREARLAFLDKTSEKVKANKIAFGHTMNDQAENVLFRLLRGSGTKGLSSMRPLDGNVIRPLLTISRAEIESYLHHKKRSFRVDSSNDDMRFTRNRIRHNLIPFLKEQFNPEIVETLARMAAILSEENAFLDAVISGIIVKEARIKNRKVDISVEILKHLPPALSRRLLRRILQIVRGNLQSITFKDIENIREFLIKSRGNRNALLAPSISVKIYEDTINFARSSHPDSYYREFQKALKIRGVTEIPGQEFSIEAKILNREDFSDDLKAGGKEKAFLDFDKTGERLLVRSIKKGDNFHPFNSPGKKKVSDFFIDRKVPQERRKKALIIASKKQIVWVAGHQIDDRCKVDHKTSRVLMMKLKKMSPESKNIVF
jgi:tRNA(Ile)-lysidine synthase